ncbi:MAG TPA: PilZ domain-containing protein [Spirochaetota bacterium]|jgi:c-di-GMP-binding flagellar brake protein YcgR|nr:MAG: PilZ domain protein [Spirochaetes bacterium ADurb.Bin133]HNZ26034.1 PilZ domain-containing protein [Spirochaetota bacterium]HOF00561.1 PilZ domain-containing protein [Spirochaetota bacterium]HOS32585.1 PilZ domain-containing protein [Spirochaetota bacterium]HOS54655.1 PilZ domain-containing protein [Spirochaetota bacterium]
MKSEKRKFTRIRETIQIKYEIIDSSSKILQTSYTQDISAGGFLIRLNSPLPIGSVLKLKFFIKDGSEFIPAEARVIRIDEIVADRVYEAGVELINVDKKDFELLMRYVTKKTT